MIRIALAGLGRISRRVAEGIGYAENASLYAVVSRDSKKAASFISEYGGEIAYASLGDALKDEKIDLVYLTLPNQLHYGAIRECLNAGKNVICEKPMVDSTEKIRELFALAREKGCFLMEAEKELFTPLTAKIRELIESGAIGEIRAISADYASRLSDDGIPEDHWVLSRDFGGCAGDIGVYPIAYVNSFAGGAVKSIGAVSADLIEGVDGFMNASILYDSGVAASVTASWFWKPGRHKGRAYIGGSSGYLIVDDYWKNTQAVLVKDGREERIEVRQFSDFTGEIEHGCQCIEQGLSESPVLGEAASLEIMKVLEAVKKPGSAEKE